ncbi:MAG TPA: carboxypeptidase-like regulatory domain-containing protein, partial [Pedobacter sp.]
MKKKVLYLLGAILLLGVQAYAQTRTVTGRVTDAGDGSPLPGVNISLDRGVGTKTEANGTYSLKVPPGKHSLTFSFVGYASRTVSITSETLNVTLTSVQNQLSEVVVSGYSNLNKKDFTGSAVKVSAAQIANKPVQSFDQALA